MKNRGLIAAVILVVGVSILVVGGNQPVYNQRTNPNITASSMVQTSKLKDQSTDNLEKLTEKLTEVQTQTLNPALDENSNAVKTGDTVRVNYRGWLASNGEIFDQSFNRGDQGFTFTVGEGVIEGWSEGVVGMKVGEIRRLRIPAEKGYGDQSVGTIPANADLIFDVELLEIK